VNEIEGDFAHLVDKIEQMKRTSGDGIALSAGRRDC
jgi:hypothetical protein